MRLQPEHVAVFHERFCDMYDGVVRKIELDVGVASRLCRIEVVCQDRDSRSGWSRVTLVVSGAKEFSFKLDKRTFEVLSDGVQFAWKDDRVFVVLDAYPDDGPGLPDLTKNTAYVAGETCDWSCVEEPV
ncbi:hypothetical protein LZ198_24550 [Myxococcus sp. K15C18031901]|uniref:hypothetical protein n=1 Tax=Myxococcus dinghuensis TaxID=2906761 RepID=UPI0020A8359F|nr:hypothetical protein [Myxococcus dinghuensis]MCP3102042.1 hypothetical protein [Myxococcus dinghuensis]